MNIREDSDENNKFCVYIYKTNNLYHKCDKLLSVEIKFNVIIWCFFEQVVGKLTTPFQYFETFKIVHFYQWLNKILLWDLLN